MIEILSSLVEFLTYSQPNSSFAIAPLALLAIGAATGAAKHMAVDAPKAARQRKLRAETARYSPWTGMNPQNVQVDSPDMLSGMMGGATQAASLGQSGMLGQDLKKQLAPAPTDMQQLIQAMGSKQAPGAPATMQPQTGGYYSGQPGLMQGQAGASLGKFQQRPPWMAMGGR